VAKIRDKEDASPSVSNHTRKAGKIPGSNLRDKLYGLLKTQFHTVEIERKLIATTADIYYLEDLSRFKKNRVAVECKDWAKPPTSYDLAAIYNLYSPSFGKEIDYLIVVGRHDLSQQPADTAKELENFQYISFEKFVTSMMNFSLVLQDNIASWSTHDSSRNYVPSHISEGDETLFSFTNNWLSGDANALIVYGGYGIGKTSFSLHLLNYLTLKYQEGVFQRIPIRIPLGDLFHRHDTKALICSALQGNDGGANVKNFTYNLFLQLVQQGHVLLILDGFDEMRHAMDVQSFDDTFSDMACLFEGDSKVILLGRPDSFFSDDEEDKIFESFRNAGAEIDKVEIGMLNKQQVETYLNTATRKRRTSAEELDALKEHVLSNELDVLSRPVQLKMFCSVIDKFCGKKHTFSRYQLYKTFIYEFIKREGKKNSRKISAQTNDHIAGFSDPRSIFMQNIAWWLLTVKRENRFTVEEIPETLVPAEFRSGNSYDGSLKEAILGSIIEPRRGKYASGALGFKGRQYYFPHKSYMEFLCAEYVSRVRLTADVAAEFFPHANPEIISFLHENPDTDRGRIREGLRHIKGEVSGGVMRFLSDGAYYVDNREHLNSRDASVHELYIAYLNLMETSGSVKTLSGFLVNSLRNSRSVAKVAACLAMIGDHLGRNHDEDLLQSTVQVIVEALGDLKSLSSARQIITTINEPNVLRAVAAYCFRVQEGKLLFDILEFKRIARWSCRRGFYLLGLDSVPTQRLREYEIPYTYFTDSALVEKRVNELHAEKKSSFVSFRFDGEFEGLSTY
jgi:hypothetical protein